MTTYRFRRHAKNNMRWSRVGLTQEQVVDIVENPDAETPTHEGQTNAWRQRETDWIRVTWIAENDATVIISVNRDKAGPPG